MKLPISWLNEYIKVDDIDIKELANKLVNIGFEVEEIIYTGEDIEKVFAGKIIDIKPHPDAEKLQICEVDFSNEKLTIVTGAKNIKIGDIVPVAKDGARLPEGKTIVSSPLRGVLSHGMMCSGKELGIDDSVICGASVDGILILPAQTIVGTDVKEVLGLNEYVFDVSVTANRPDCQSVYGMAREVAVMLSRELKPLNLKYETVASDSKMNIKISNYELCSRYVGQIIDKVKVIDSPEWLKRRLKLCGHNPINNIVDITNYVLLEVGQPLHAFDIRQIEGGINIREAKTDEKITALDKNIYTLKESMLVIADNKKPLAIAGVMGGEHSGIVSDTTCVLLEAARFSRGTVRATSRALGLRSDSSARYEKGVDWQSVDTGRKRALSLIYQMGAGVILSDEFMDSITPPKEKVINTSASQICSVLGINIKTDKIVQILNSLQITTEQSKDKLKCKIPLFREDIDNFTDLAEEIIRFYGYDNINSTLFTPSKNTLGGLNDRQKRIQSVKDYLIGKSAYEVVSYSFINPNQYDMINVSSAEKESLIRICNPLSEEYSVMRTQLIGSMLDIISLNISKKNSDFRLFEVARVYIPEKLPFESLPKENEILTFGFVGDAEDFYSIKDVVVNLFNTKDKFTYSYSNKGWLHPGKSADLFSGDKFIGSFGKIHPTVAKKYHLPENVYLAEISLETYLNKATEYTKFIPLPKYPGVERDLALIVPIDLNVGDIISVIKSAAKNLCESVELFDVYQGEQIEKGFKSVAFSIKLQSSEKTLTEQDIQECVNNILEKLEKKLGAKLRL